MTPGARAAAAIEILARIDSPESPPADKAMADWGRASRFAGAKDRSAVAAMVYGVLRRRGQIDWWLNRLGALDPGATPEIRQRVIVWLRLGEGWRLDDLEQAFTGERHAPPPPIPREKRLMIELDQQDGFALSCQPLAASANLPDWLAEPMASLYGDDADRQLLAHGEEAPVDLRVNRLKTDRETLRARLAAEGVETEPTPYSPIGLRLRERRPLTGLASFKEGLFEPQDEGSQLAAVLCDAKPKMQVVDFCAGAGGKTLALAAAMENSGRVVACDVSEARLKRAAQRLKRAGAFTVERRQLTSERDKWIKRRAGRFDGGFDRVLVDAPCSGSGTWRRNPDQKWKLTPTDLAALSEKQDAILDSAARLVSKGGRLIYVTCSLLEAENEARVARFLEARTDFFAHPIKEVWEDTVGAETPFPSSGQVLSLRLTPADHGTDGFFVAILGRKL